MGNNIFSQVVVSSMETSRMDETGVAHFSPRNSPPGDSLSKRGVGASANQPDQLSDLARALEAYKAALIAAGLPVPELPGASSTSLAGAGKGRGPNTYREALASRGEASADPEPSESSRAPQLSTNRRGSPPVSGEADAPTEGLRVRPVLSDNASGQTSLVSRPGTRSNGGAEVETGAREAGRSRVEKEGVGVRGLRSTTTAWSGEPVHRGAGRSADATGEPSGGPEYDPIASRLSKERGDRRRAAEALGAKARAGGPHVPRSAFVKRSSGTERTVPAGRTHARPTTRHQVGVLLRAQLGVGGVVSGPERERAEPSSVKRKVPLQSEAGKPLLHGPEAFANSSRAVQAPPTKGGLVVSARGARVDVDLTKGSTSISDLSERISRLTREIFASESDSGGHEEGAEWETVSRKSSRKSRATPLGAPPAGRAAGRAPPLVIARRCSA